MSPTLTGASREGTDCTDAMSDVLAVHGNQCAAINFWEFEIRSLAAAAIVAADILARRGGYADAMDVQFLPFGAAPSS